MPTQHKIVDSGPEFRANKIRRSYPRTLHEHQLVRRGVVVFKTNIFITNAPVARMPPARPGSDYPQLIVDDERSGGHVRT